MTATEKIVREFWRLMGTNDFYSASAVLAPDFVLDWPQSGERIRGPENFADVNSEYPSHGPWKFGINSLVAGPDSAVTDVSVTDGVVHARAITFFTVEKGKIARITEFWPDPFPAAENRKHLVERIK
ncbi:MAG TPA: nuclear transport factor 2 family protein [Elusimicrobiales bacterium]|nr:nuclear transport factor 2 family protein [Elusimicrobiales bacterium]